MRALPLGGYVSFPEAIPENEEDKEAREAKGEKEDEDEVRYSEDDPDLIQNRPALQVRSTSLSSFLRPMFFLAPPLCCAPFHFSFLPSSFPLLPPSHVRTAAPPTFFLTNAAFARFLLSSLLSLLSPHTITFFPQPPSPNSSDAR